MGRLCTIQYNRRDGSSIETQSENRPGDFMLTVSKISTITLNAVTPKSVLSLSENCDLVKE